MTPTKPSNKGATPSAAQVPASSSAVPVPSDQEIKTAEAFAQYQAYVLALDNPGSEEPRRWVMPALNPNLT